ncbi:MAG: glycosyltransferase [Muribaculaceae bacterium]|nr:glycosyltransferase [Muribaculaceae bacterium]
MTYSIAIRTLGTGGDNYRRLLRSITAQTVQPERVVVYIAEGYARPPFTVGREEYVQVPKGMAAQRALQYKEITSDCILLLDDDVELAPDTAARMLEAMSRNDADCVAADTFCNHLMSPGAKIRAAITALALPSRSGGTAFRIRPSGAFSYVAAPAAAACLPSDSAAGPAAMWRRCAFLRLRMSDELWVEQDGFAYGEDLVMYHKLVVNGGRLFVLFDSGAVHLDSGCSSGAFRRSPRRMYVRTKNNLIIWWRCIYSPDPSARKLMCFGGRMAWSFLVACAAIMPLQFMRGTRDGLRYLRSATYKSIPPYRLPS